MEFFSCVSPTKDAFRTNEKDYQIRPLKAEEFFAAQHRKVPKNGDGVQQSVGGESMVGGSPAESNNTQ